MNTTNSEVRLEDGTSSETPPGDNLLLDAARTSAAAYAQIARSTGGRVYVDEALGLHMADAGSPNPFGNTAHLLRPVPVTDTDRLATALHDFYGQSDGGTYLVFSPWPTGDLTTRGFALAGHPPLMIRPAGTLPPGGGRLKIETVTDPQGLEVFEQTLAEAFPSEELLPFGSAQRMYGDAALGSDWTFYVGHEDGRPVATASAFVSNEIVLVEAVSVRPECRGRGYGEAITAAATGTRSDRPAALLSSDPGRGVYQRLGYLPVMRFTLWIGVR